MTLVWRPGFMFDADASTYIEAVEAADTQALETGVRYAINDFVIGCKNDGIWDAIKASCILAGARTLDGALVPLVGTAPTNFNFVAGDYNRETGLKGDGSTKYLDSNRNNNADPQDSSHLSCFVTEDFGNLRLGGDQRVDLGNFNGRNYMLSTQSGCRTGGISFSHTGLGLQGISRSTSAYYFARNGSVTTTQSSQSQTPANYNIYILAYNGQLGVSYSTSRLSLYSIGESLDLALLDTRVTDLVTAIGAAIP